jgi:hypothetical protein
VRATEGHEVEEVVVFDLINLEQLSASMDEAVEAEVPSPFKESGMNVSYTMTCSSSG